MDVLAFPFRFLSNGSAAKVVQGSDADMAQKLLALLQTEPNELPLAPQFGINDPTFDVLASDEVIAAAAEFYPEIRIDKVDEALFDDGRTAIQIYFTGA